MKRHTIELEGLQEWLRETQVMFAKSTKDRKELRVDLSGNIVVIIDGIEVYKGKQPHHAVKAYNEI